MQREARSDKILLLGVDGMDPRLTKKYVEKGVMPNVKKYIEAGAQREDLTMLGGHPTVTPPMWTTLATGTYANVHGITGFYRKGPELDIVEYNIDSRFCKAEPLWNAFAEAGKKTLVWHWPGSSWPPTSDSENLMVVDGTSPGSIGMAVAQVDTEFLVAASETIPTATMLPQAARDAKALCVITDLEEQIDAFDGEKRFGFDHSTKTIIYRESQFSGSYENVMPTADVAQSPIKPATGWAAAPADAKEFVILLSKGFVRRPALILKNEEGIYDKVAVYKSKKETEPFVVCSIGEMVAEVVDEAIKNDKKYEKVNRNFKLIELDPDGSRLILYVSAGMDMTNDSVWHPTRLFKEVTENVGYPTPTSMLCGDQDGMLITDCMLANWDVSAEWQANSMLHLIESENLDIVFSHYHAVDLEGHMVVRYMADRSINKNPVSVAEKWMEDIYVQLDNYLGKFIHLLDEGWTIMIFSDHALVAPAYQVPSIVELSGIATPYMEELGYTVLKRNEKGERIGDIDWTKTTAIVQREGHVYLNIKGRDTHTMDDGTILDGLVDPADQYELEEKIMTDLYNLKSPETGHRIVSVALRNRDAVLLGMGGPDSGDIFFWLAEGYNVDHADCISTTYGEADTSISPIFIAAGKGLKKGFTTDRIIRQVDFAPTVAVLGGVRMPAKCEGAPVYQIFEEEF